ncbi:MAG TPA: SRPBCC family protein [Flavisolibacter sp.]|nr:SRPBCC family protein [Flavisolibacter sp.]
MKILKRIGLVVLSLVVLLLVVALFIKKEYTVEREVIVNKSNSDAFNFIKYAKNQDHYNKWVQADPNAKKEFRGTDGTIGFVYAWDGNKDIGKGEQEIKNIEEGKRIDFSLHFIEPMESNANAWIVTEPVSNQQTKIKWGMHGRSPYPLNLVNLFVPSILGQDLDASLDKLKAILEK